MIIELIFVLIFIISSGFFSGVETGIYRLSPLRLRLGRKLKPKRYAILEGLLHDKQSMIFATLIGSNLSNYLATSIVTGIFMTIADSEHLAEVYTTAILTPVLFIFGEVLPKNIYFSIPDKAMPPSAWLSMASKKIFTACGIIPLLKLLTLLAEKIAGLSRTTEKLITTARKLEILEIIRQTHEEGILGRVPAALIDRFVSVSQIQTGSAATPISKVNLINIKTSHSQLIEKLKTCDEQYWLVYRDSKQDIAGYIDIYQTLNCGRDFSELTDFIKPLLEISEQKSMAEALDMITSEKIILVTRKSILPELKTPMGLFTLNELIEEIAASTESAG